jgi:predicted PurR-regulated permease PerM
MTILDVFLIVLILAACALCIYLIISLKKINNSIEILQKDLHELSEKTIPVVENLTVITERAARITGEAEDYWSSLTESIEGIKTKISRFGKDSGRDKTNRPVEDFIRNLRAIFMGISAFWDNIKK